MPAQSAKVIKLFPAPPKLKLTLNFNFEEEIVRVAYFRLLETGKLKFAQYVARFGNKPRPRELMEEPHGRQRSV